LRVAMDFFSLAIYFFSLDERRRKKGNGQWLGSNDFDTKFHVGHSENNLHTEKIHTNSQMISLLFNPSLSL